MKLKYGQGSITRRQRVRKDGSRYTYYQGKYYINGQAEYITTKTKEECFMLLKAATKNGVKQLTTRYTLREWLEEYFSAYKQNTLAEKTLKDYRAAIKNYMPEILLRRNIKDIKAVDLQKVVNAAAEKFPRRARTLFDIINGAFREAWNNDLLTKEVTKGLKRPSVTSREEKPLTAEQQKKIGGLPDKCMRDVLTAYIWSGCRMSELLSLKPEYWDKEKKTLYIDGTKTATSKRTIPVFPPLEKVLSGLDMSGGRLFNLSAKTLKRKKAEAEKQLGFNFTIKSLRHTFNQNLTEMGVLDIVGAAWMGHSKPTTTKKTYTHLTESLQNEAVRIVESNLNETDG